MLFLVVYHVINNPDVCIINTRQVRIDVGISDTDTERVTQRMRYHVLLYTNVECYSALILLNS